MKGEKGRGMHTTFKWFRKESYTRTCISFSSATQSCRTPCNPMDCSTPGLPVYRQLPELAQTDIHCSGDAIQPSHPLSSPSPPAFNLSQQQGLFQWVGSSQQVAKCLEFQLQHQFRTDFFRINWLDLIAVQGTLKSLLQHYSSKPSVLQHSVFFIVQLSQPSMTTGKTISLTTQTFVGKLMFLLINMLSRLVITFLPRSKCPLISWLQSLSAVILEPPKVKSDTCFHCFPIYSPWSERTGCHNLCFLNVEL